jgi:hypothetical protein
MHFGITAKVDEQSFTILQFINLQPKDSKNTGSQKTIEACCAKKTWYAAD